MTTDYQPPPGWPAMSIAEAHTRLTAPGSRFEMEERDIRGVRLRVWRHAPATLGELFQTARAYGDRTCLVYEGERSTYASFAGAVLALARDLRESGLAKGDRVAIAMRNVPEWPVAFFAGSICGAVVTACNAWWTGRELETVLNDCGATIAFVDEARLARLRPHLTGCPQLRRIYTSRMADVASSRETAATLVDLQSVIGHVADWPTLPVHPLPDVVLDPEDDATIFYTSGTTGRPKGALSTHRSVCSNTLTTAAAQARAYLRRGEEPPTPGPGDPQRAILLAIPLFHVIGCMPWLIANLHRGSKIVLMPKWETERALALIERERVTQAGGVPTIAWRLLEHPHRGDYDLASLDAITFGGAPAPPELVRALHQAFPRANLANGWGMTEVTSSFASNNAEDCLVRPDSCGVPAPTNDWKIVAHDGRELPIGEVGELWVRGPQVIKGYYNQPGAWTEAFVDGWLRTGDLARLDAERFCFIVDRTKDIVIRGGEKIFCLEVEHVLFEHPAVMDAAVIGRLNPHLGEEPVAVVHLKPGSEVGADDLRAFVAERLAAFSVPVEIRFWREPLPRNAVDKIDKRELRRLFEA